MSSIVSVQSRSRNARATRRLSVLASAAPAPASMGAADGVDWRSVARVLWRWVDRPRVIEALLAFAILAQLASIGIELRNGPDAGPSLVNPPDGAAPTMRPTESAESRLATLVAAHLFGEVEGEPAVAVAPPSLQLIGAFVPQAEDAVATANGPGAVPAFSSPDAVLPGGLAEELRALWGEAARVPARPGAIAWVKEAGGPPVRVQVGETISGATVARIESRAITLALGARTLTVAFPENPYVAMLRGETDRATPVEESDQIPAELASKILRYQPVMGPSGELGGFRLFPGAEAGALAKLGLAAGDVLLAIEGRPITSSGDLKPLLRALKNPARLRVRVGRGTGPKELTLFANAAPPAGGAVRPSSSPSTQALQGVPRHGLQ